MTVIEDTMASSDSNADVADDIEATENAESDDETEFLGPGPEESLEMNSSAEETFSTE